MLKRITEDIKRRLTSRNYITRRLCSGNSITRKLFKNYIKLKGEIGQGYIKKPYHPVSVQTDLIEYSITPYKHNAKNYKKYNPPSKYIVHPRLIRGVISEGDWDIDRYNFNEDMNYIAFRQKFVQGSKWEDTVYYQKFQRKLENKGHGKRGAKNFEELKDKYLAECSDIYRDIKDNGYKTQNQLGGNSEHEIEVGVSRNGEILCIDGKHRLSIAKILDLKEIPVIVNIWHRKYINWVKENTDIENITSETAIQPILDGRAKIIRDTKE